MMIKFVRFNRFLLLVLAVALASSGCRTSEQKKKLATILELHLEVSADGATDNEAITISHDPTVEVNVEKEPFVDGADVSDAKVVDDDLGGFKLRLKFNWRGTQLLEGITASNRGKRIAVYALFGQARWLGAPIIRNKISDGILTFTPDATREEADRIVVGLNEIAKQLKKDDKL